MEQPRSFSALFSFFKTKMRDSVQIESKVTKEDDVADAEKSVEV